MIFFIIPFLNIVLIIMKLKNKSILQKKNIKQYLGIFYEEYQKDEYKGLFY